MFRSQLISSKFLVYELRDSIYAFAINPNISWLNTSSVAE